MVLVFTFVFAAASGAFPTESVVKAASVSCDVKFTKPAICCDVGDTIDLTQCGVQLSKDKPMVTSGISWTYNGSAVTEFKPSSAGTYTLVASAGGVSKNIYVVAKNAADTDYVLYTNDFSGGLSGFREIEKSEGAYYGTSGGVMYIDASATADTYVRILLPEFLDAFGNIKIEARVRITSSQDDGKWIALMSRVQNANYPYVQACMRYNTEQSNGVEITERTFGNYWSVAAANWVDNISESNYNVISYELEDTSSVFSINGNAVAKFNNTPFAAGATGMQVRGARYTLDYITITLNGNEPKMTSCDASYSKPALRAETGDTLDLTACDVQFTADSLYTKGTDIVWKKDGSVITTFEPQKPGITELTATAGGVTKSVYVVTRWQDDREYVLYYEDFSTAPSDLRVIETTGTTTAYYDAASGTYVIDASGSEANYGRVLLPSYLDNFGDYMFEAGITDTNATTERNWSALMYRVQNESFPYMQMCIRYNAAQDDGVEITQRTEDNLWNVMSKVWCSNKSSGGYNSYSVYARNNMSTVCVNGVEIASNKYTPYTNGALGFQVRGLKSTIDYVKVTLGDTTAKEDTSVSCGVACSMPAIGCNAGQTVLLNECYVQFVYGVEPVLGSEVEWTLNGKVITEFEAPLGITKLNASYNDRNLEVWVVAKKSTDYEHVFYYNDFSTSADGAEMRVIETSNGGSAYWSNGTYVLNGSAGADSYVRILLPEELNIFGDAEYLASLKLTNPVDSTKWGSMMYRVQNGNFPYCQGCLRYESNVDNGVEISQRTSSNEWNVTQKGAYAGWTKDQYNTWLVNPSAKYTGLAMNNTHLLTEYATPYYNGDWGFQVRGLTMTIDYVKLSFQYNHTKESIYVLPGNYADVRDPETGINIAPAIVTEVETMEEFTNLAKDSPAVAIMTYELVNGVGTIVFQDGTVTPEKALDKTSGTIIPAFRVKSEDAAASVATFLMNNDQRDAFVVADQPSYLNKANSTWKHVKGVMDYRGVSYWATPEALRAEATANGATILMLTSEYATKERVRYFQDMYSCVWIIVGEGKTASVEAINKGPYGIVTPDRTVTESCYEDYYAQNTLVRRTNVIGHRGTPTMAQENSLSGLKISYQNGANMVECDIYKATDNVLVIMHDSTIDRTTNGSGYISQMSSTQLKQYVIDQYSSYATEPIPTLEDFFAYISGDVSKKLVVEVKTGDTAYASILRGLIEKYNVWEQIVVISFGSGSLAAIREQLPGIPISLLSSAVALDENDPIVSASNIVDWVQNFGSVYSPGYGGLGGNIIRECAYRGITLWPWTVDSRAVFDNLFLNTVGGITTNYSQWAATLIESLDVNSNGRVIATQYNGTTLDVTSSAEIVVVEDTLGISYSNGKVTVPENKGGFASYFFRYKSTTGTGIEYYTVTEIQTVEVAGGEIESLELVSGSTLSLDSGNLMGISPDHTVASVKAQFKYAVTISHVNGAVLADSEVVPTGAIVALTSDSTKCATAIMLGDVNGDGTLDSTDYLRIKSYFLKTSDLTGVYYIAADCDKDGTITSTDYLRLKGHFLKQYDLFA